MIQEHLVQYSPEETRLALRELITPDPDKRQFSLKRIGIATFAVAIIFKLPTHILLKALYSCAAAWWIITWDWPEAQLGKARKLTREGKHIEAREICTDLIERFPKKAAAYVHRGMSLLHDDLPAAESDFDQALMLNPDYGYAWIGKGQLRMIEGKPSEAVNCFQRAAFDATYVPYANFLMFNVAFADGELEKATAHAKMLAGHPSWIGQHHALLGAIHFESGDFPSAEHYLRLAFDVLKSPDLLASQITAAFRDGRYEWAVDKANRLVQSNPDSFHALCATSWILSTCPKPELRDGKKSLNLALRAVCLGNNWGAQATLAAAYAEVGDFENAIQQIDEALTQCPKFRLQMFRSMSSTFRRNQPFRDDGICCDSFQNSPAESGD